MLVLDALQSIKESAHNEDKNQNFAPMAFSMAATS